MKVAKPPLKQRISEWYSNLKHNHQRNTIANSKPIGVEPVIPPESSPEVRSIYNNPGFLRRWLAIGVLTLGLGWAMFGYHSCNRTPIIPNHHLQKHNIVSTYAVDRDIAVQSGQTVWEITRNNYHLNTDRSITQGIKRVSDYNYQISPADSPLEHAARSDTKAIIDGVVVNQPDGIPFDDVPVGMRITLPKVDTTRITSIAYRDETTGTWYDEHIQPLSGSPYETITPPKGAELIGQTETVTGTITVPINKLGDSTSIASIVDESSNPDTDANITSLLGAETATASAGIVSFLGTSPKNKYDGMKQKIIYDQNIIEDVASKYAASDMTVQQIAQYAQEKYGVHMSASTARRRALEYFNTAIANSTNNQTTDTPAYTPLTSRKSVRTQFGDSAMNLATIVDPNYIITSKAA